MNIIYNITEKNFPKKIVDDFIVQPNKSDKRRCVLVCESDYGCVYSVEKLGNYLELKRSWFQRRKKTYGFDHPYFLVKAIPAPGKRKVRKPNKKETVTDYAPVNMINIGRGQNVKNYDYLGKENLHVSSVKISPPKELSVPKMRHMLDKFIAKKRRQGLVVPTGEYNSFSKKMIISDPALSPEA